MTDQIRTALVELVRVLTDVSSDSVPTQVFVAYCAARTALAEQPSPSESLQKTQQLAETSSEIVVTKNEAGQIVAVTRQDEEGRILEVIAESEPPSAREPLSDEQVAQLWSPHPGGEARRPIIGWAKVRDFADNIIAEYERINGIVSPSPTQSPWISVEDRMPAPDSGEVLVWLTGGRCAFDEWHIYSEDPTGMGGATLEMGLMWRDYEFDEVTHWMPLPVAPQQEGSS